MQDTENQETPKSELIVSIPSADTFAPSKPTALKEVHAKSIADKFVTIFGITVIGSLLGGFALIAGVLMQHPSDALSVAQTFVPDYLRGVSTFEVTVFGTPLGVILGYYFSSRSRD